MSEWKGHEKLSSTLKWREKISVEIFHFTTFRSSHCRAFSSFIVVRFLLPNERGSFSERIKEVGENNKATQVDSPPAHARTPKRSHFLMKFEFHHTRWRRRQQTQNFLSFFSCLHGGNQKPTKARNENWEMGKGIFICFQSLFSLCFLSHHYYPSSLWLLFPFSGCVCFFFHFTISRRVLSLALFLCIPPSQPLAASFEVCPRPPTHHKRSSVEMRKKKGREINSLNSISPLMSRTFILMYRARLWIVNFSSQLRASRVVNYLQCDASRSISLHCNLLHPLELFPQHPAASTFHLFFCTIFTTPTLLLRGALTEPTEKHNWYSVNPKTKWEEFSRIEIRPGAWITSLTILGNCSLRSRENPSLSGEETSARRENLRTLVEFSPVFR